MHNDTEKALFACLVTKLSALGEDWMMQGSAKAGAQGHGVGLAMLLDAGPGGDASPTFRGTPKRLDVATAEELAQILRTGRLNPTAECWKALPLEVRSTKLMAFDWKLVDVLLNNDDL